MPPDLLHLILLALANPAAIAAGYFLGRRADQPQKILVAGFAAGFAGILWIWLLGRLGVDTGNPRSVAGMFLLCCGFGFGWGWLGWKVRQMKARAENEGQIES